MEHIIVTPNNPEFLPRMIAKPFKMRDCDYVKNFYFNNVTLKNIDCFAEIAESAKDRIEITLGNIVADSPEALEFHISNMHDAKKWYWGDPDLPQDQI